jgi:hypothetical protein
VGLGCLPVASDIERRPVSDAEELAQRHFNTTATDVVNALAARTLDRKDVPDDLLEAIAAEGIVSDEDPDDRAGWHWDEDEAEAD